MPVSQELHSTNATEERSDGRPENDTLMSPADTQIEPTSPDDSHATEHIASDLETGTVAVRSDTDIPDSQRERSHHEARNAQRARSNIDPRVNTVASRAGSKPVQMVLSTANASWNLRRAAADTPDRPAKRHKPDRPQPVADGQQAISTGIADLRTQLLGFARAGSQIASGKAWEEGAEDVDQETAMEVDELAPDADDGSESEAEGGERPGPDTIDKNKAAAHQSCLPLGVDITEAAESVQKQIKADVPTLPQVVEDRIEEGVEPYEQNSQAKLSSKLQKVVSRLPEIIRTTKGNDISINLDFTKLGTSWKELQNYLTSSVHTTNSVDSQRQGDLSRDAGIQTDDDKAQEALSRIIDKSDFLTMDVIGQFNRGFIIARRRKPERSAELAMDDLFIIDQHAADEKYNFEQLQESTRIESQKLIR